MTIGSERWSGEHPATMFAVSPEMVAASRQRVGRSDLVLSVAAPDCYAAVEALSRSASRQEMLSPLTADLIEWFIDRNPFGQGFVVTASDTGSGTLIGYFLFYPWPLTRRDPLGQLLECPVFLFVRLYVAPEHRRRGVFHAMTRFGLDLVARIGVGMAYTVPNPRSTRGFLKFGHQHAGDLPFWARPVVPGWGRFIGGSRRGGGFRVDRCRRFEDAWQPNPGRDLPESTIAWSPRRVELLNWRFADRPDGDYEIRYVHSGDRVVGYLVTRRMLIKGIRVLVVCDAWLDGFDPGAFRAGLEDALQSGKHVRLAIAFGGTGAPGFQRALRRAGFLVCPRRLQPQPVAVIGCGVGESSCPTSMPRVGEWHLTPMDWDVF